MSRIVLINRFYAPDDAPTAGLLTDLAQYLAAEGETVRVLTSRMRYQKRAAPLPAHACLHGVEVVRLRTIGFGRGLLLGRAVDYFSFYFNVFFAVLRYVGRGDRVVAMTDPPFLGAVILPALRLRRAHLVNWMQDVFPEVAASLGFAVARGVSGAVLARVRDYSLKAARANVVIGRRMRAVVEKRGANNVTVIPNWVDTDRMRGVGAADNTTRRAWGLEDKFVVGYSGNLGRAHEARTLLHAITALRHRPDIHFLLIGGGYQFSWLQDAIARASLPNCTVREYQPPARLRESLSAADIHLVSLRPEAEGLMVPSKIYNAMAVGRPLIFVGDVRGEVAAIVGAADCGRVVAAGFDSALAAAIEWFAERPSQVRRMGANARAYAVAYCGRDHALACWRRVLQDATD